MGSIQEWRRTAEELRGEANKILSPDNAETLKGDVGQQIAAIIGRVGAMVFEAKADIVEAIIASAGSSDPAMVKRRAIMERNDAIRRAAASGNWVEFDRLTVEGVAAG